MILFLKIFLQKLESLQNSPCYFFFFSCKENPTSSIQNNLPPETYIWVDTIAQTLSSQIKLHWWGDDPDGFVKGFNVSIDGTNWNFTTQKESTFTLTLGSQVFDTSLIQISAIDNQNKIDPTPAKIKSIIKNTPPKISFDSFSEIPTQTLPVATFSFHASDIDGKNTIKNIFIALNDTSQNSWRVIPNNISLLTLVADLSDTSKNIVDANVKSGNNLLSLNLSIPNLKLNSLNVFYVYCEDISGAKSSIIRMPDSSKNWFVKKPKGRRKFY